MARGHIVSIAVKKQKDGDKFIEAKVRFQHDTEDLAFLGNNIEVVSDFEITPTQGELFAKGKKRTGTDD